MILTALRTFGYDLVHLNHDHPVRRRAMLMTKAGIDLVLDVGAGHGEFAREIRAFGYGGRIVSFEPLPVSFGTLFEAVAKDSAWEARNYALGDNNEEMTLNRAANDASSSFLEMLPAHRDAAPSARFIGTETVMVRRLDDIFAEVCSAAKRPYLKVDVQGYESKVLTGGRAALKLVQMVQLETALQPLYDGDLGVMQAIILLESHSFRPVSFEHGFTDPKSGQQLQVNIVFERRE